MIMRSMIMMRMITMDSSHSAAVVSVNNDHADHDNDHDDDHDDDHDGGLWKKHCLTKWMYGYF